MKNIKEELMEEFEIKAVKILLRTPSLALSLKSFLSKALDRVREETILECEGAVAEKKKELPHAGYTRVEASTYSHAMGYNTCRATSIKNIQALYKNK